MTRKLRYEIDLTVPRGPGGAEGPPLRSVSLDDLEGLARLMLDAYVGTIDYEGEDLDDARTEVRDFLDSESAWLNRSFAIEDDGKIVSGILVSEAECNPFIGYVMTIPSHKDKGLARTLTDHTLRLLAQDGHKSVALYITEGNSPSESLFRSVGATRVQEPKAV